MRHLKMWKNWKPVGRGATAVKGHVMSGQSSAALEPATTLKSSHRCRNVPSKGSQRYDETKRGMRAFKPCRNCIEEDCESDTAKVCGHIFGRRCLRRFIQMSGTRVDLVDGCRRCKPIARLVEGRSRTDRCDFSLVNQSSCSKIHSSFW